LIVKTKNSSRGFTNIAKGLDSRMLKLKMGCPAIASWVMKSGKFSGCPNDGTDITAFIAIAEDTSISKVICICGTTMFDADNVIYSATKRRITFVNKTVFTETIGPFFYKSAKVLGDVRTIIHWVNVLCSMLGRDIGGHELLPTVADVLAGDIDPVLSSLQWSVRRFFLERSSVQPALSQFPKALVVGIGILMTLDSIFNYSSSTERIALSVAIAPSSNPLTPVIFIPS
jgi:hypothetical protein